MARDTLQTIHPVAGMPKERPPTLAGGGQLAFQRGTGARGQTEAGQACQLRMIREQNDHPFGGASPWTAGDLETSEESGRQESSEDQKGNGREAYRIAKCFLRCRVDDRACTFQRLHCSRLLSFDVAMMFSI